MAENSQKPEDAVCDDGEVKTEASSVKQEQPKEIGGRKGPEPTRYGDWEKNGIISDF